MKRLILFLIAGLFSATAQAQICREMPEVLSPVDQNMVDELEDIIANGSGQDSTSYILVGDSITDSTYYMNNCSFPYGDHFSTYGWISIKDLQCYPELTDSLDYYEQSGVYTRNSLAAEASRPSSWPLIGSPSPLEQEIAVANPLFAVIMFGTNDMLMTGVELQDIVDNLIAIGEECVSQGIIPVFKSPPPRVNYYSEMQLLSDMLDAECAARHWPFINYHDASLPLPNYGLGTDGVHPRYYTYNRMCVFHDEALNYGANMHALLTLKMMDDLYHAIVLGEPVGGTDIDVDVDTDVDSDMDVDTDSDSGGDSDSDTGSETEPDSYLYPCGDSGHDDDLDEVCSCEDNCPMIYNPDQIDTNQDGIGDACQPC